MENAVELPVVAATRLELGTGYVKLVLGFRFSSTSASLSGLETQWKAISASKASRSLSVKPACLSWPLTLSVTGCYVFSQ